MLNAGRDKTSVRVSRARNSLLPTVMRFEGAAPMRAVENFGYIGPYVTGGFFR